MRTRSSRLPNPERSGTVWAGHHTLLIRGASAGGPSQLRGVEVTRLIEIETRGQHTVLLAHRVDDLGTAVAAVCRYVFASDKEVLEHARQMWGTEQVVAVRSLTGRHLRRACRRLPTPAALTWRRRIHARSAPLRKLYAKLQKLVRR